MKSYHVGPSSLSYTEDPFKYPGNTDYITKDEVEVVLKKWGEERIIPGTSSYTVKMMTLQPKCSCSMHFHSSKTETFILITGKIIVDLVNLADGSHYSIELKDIGDSVTLENNVPHAFHCPDDQLGPTVFVETSTKDSPSDNYRLSCSSGPEEDSNNR